MNIKRLVQNLINKSSLDIIRYQKKLPLLQFLKSQNIQTVFDVGANIGDFVRYTREVLPTAEIIALEPQPLCAARIRSRFPNDTHLHVLEYAAGKIEETKIFRLNTYTPSASLLPLTEKHLKSFPHAQETGQVSVTIKTLDSIYAQYRHRAQGPIFLKIDVQGYELPSLAGADEVLKHSQVVLIEACFKELYQGQGLFDDIYRVLTQKGFNYHGSISTKFDAETRIPLFEDALFIKDNP